jgi:hypothetical protein
MNESKKRDVRFWIKWRKSGAIKPLSDLPRSDKSNRYIDIFFAQGKKVLIAVWDDFQKTPAQSYIDDAINIFPKGDAICKVITNASINTGSIVEDRHVIRCLFR